MNRIDRIACAFKNRSFDSFPGLNIDSGPFLAITGKIWNYGLKKFLTTADRVGNIWPKRQPKKNL